MTHVQTGGFRRLAKSFQDLRRLLKTCECIRRPGNLSDTWRDLRRSVESFGYPEREATHRREDEPGHVVTVGECGALEDGRRQRLYLPQVFGEAPRRQLAVTVRYLREHVWKRGQSGTHQGTRVNYGREGEVRHQRTSVDTRGREARQS